MSSTFFVSPRRWVRGHGAAWLAGVLGVLGILATLIVFRIVVPEKARALVRAELDGLERRTGFEIEVDAIETAGLSGVELHGVTVRRPQNDEVVARAATAGASLGKWDILFGDKVVSDVWADEVDLYVRRRADGSFDALHDYHRLRGSEGGAENGAEEGEASGLVGAFGGRFPDVELAALTVHFPVEEGAPPWPIRHLVIDALELDGSGTDFSLEAVAAIEEYPSPHWSLPKEVVLEATVRNVLEPVKVRLAFDRPLRVERLEPYPFLRLGFDGLSIAPDRRVRLERPVVGVRGKEEASTFEAEAVEIALERWRLDPQALRVTEMILERPALRISLREGDGHLTAALERLQSALASDAKREGDDEDAGSDRRKSAADEIEAIRVRLTRFAKLVAEHLPRRVVIEDGAITVEDGRVLPVVDFASAVELRDGDFELTHARAEQRVRIDGGFEARADDQSRGEVAVAVDWDYARTRGHVEIDVERLDLSWVGQLAGPSVARYVRGGELTGHFTLRGGESSTRVGFEGQAALDAATLHVPRLAEEPITDFTGAYTFSGYYDPEEALSEPKLLKVSDFRGAGPKEDAPVRRGVLAVEKGQVRLGDITFDLRGAVHGTTVLPDALPARVELHVRLPRTPFGQVFEAVPDAVKGPLVGSTFAGDIAWQLDLELPFHRASDLAWEATTKLEGFEILEMPEELDPRRLLRAHEVTIEDPAIGFTRTVSIPAMRSPEDPRGDTPRPPWKDHDPGKKGDGPPYGEYVYVPLDVISPVLVRAIQTTEDNAFFSHDGFNFDAIRQAMERNLEEGRFVRGGSTITMQFVKNAFLGSQKTLSRKVREAFLVWLVESVVEVPKERILEIYFNIIEYGPGVFGIHEASLHYFGKRPDALTVPEVAWLVSILPNPKHYHRYYERGAISDYWFERMNRYVDAMYRGGRISAKQLVTARFKRPPFYKPEPDEPVVRRGGFHPMAYRDEPGVARDIAILEALEAREDGSRAEHLKFLDTASEMEKLRVLYGPGGPYSGFQSLPEPDQPVEGGR